MARICPLFSGSGGNSYYIGSRSQGVLIDAGPSCRRVEGMLRLCGVEPQAVQAVLVTHEHTDHVGGVRVLARKYDLPVYGTPGTLDAISSQLAGVELIDITGGAELAGMRVEPFPISHDCAQPVGYRVKTGDGRKFCLATDLGYLSEPVKEALLGCDAVVLESNHDVEMLRSGPYHPQLKRRILSSRGHLSNEACAGILPSLVRSGVRRFVLGHLSDTNNTPERALEASLAALTQAGYVRDVDYLLETAPVENSQGNVMIF